MSALGFSSSKGSFVLFLFFFHIFAEFTLPFSPASLPCVQRFFFFFFFFSFWRVERVNSSLGKTEEKQNRKIYIFIYLYIIFPLLLSVLYIPQSSDFKSQYSQFAIGREPETGGSFRRQVPLLGASRVSKIDAWLGFAFFLFKVQQ